MKLLRDVSAYPSLNHSGRINQEDKLNEKQGITTILKSDCEKTRPTSLRRTLSADMSSKKWMNQNGFSPIKQTPSPHNQTSSCPSLSSSFSSFTYFSSFEEEKEEDSEFEQVEDKGLRGTARFDIWSSIQEENRKKEIEKPTRFESWISILNQKIDEDKNNLPPPYIHPLVKRSASSLSGKSLEICTESLGSESGSDRFSSYPASETSDADDDNKEEETEQEQSNPVPVAKFDDTYNCTPYGRKKISPAKSFPPPLPSLSSANGASRRVQSSRRDGRLVLEVISIPSQRNFEAQRENGRLVLTFANKLDENENENEETEADIEEKVENVEEFDEGAVNFSENDDGGEEKGNDETGEETEEEEEAEEEVVVEKFGGGGRMGIIMEKQRRGPNGGVSVHKLGVMMNKPKPMVLANTNPSWPNKFSEVVIFEEEENGPISLPQSLPPLGGVARVITKPPSTATSFNAYEYFWRTKSTTTTLISHPSTQQSITLKNYSNEFVISKNSMPNEHQDLLLFRGNKADYLLPSGKSCKETRKSLLFWEPQCIATS